MKNLVIKSSDGLEKFDSLQELEERIWKIKKTCDNLLVEFTVEMALKAKLLRGTLNPNSPYEEDMVDLEIDGKKIIVQRHTASNPAGLIQLSTSEGENNPYLIVDLVTDKDKYYHPYIDRGLCWIIPGNPLQVFFHLNNLNNATFVKGDIANITQIAEQRVLETLQKTISNNSYLE